MKIKEVLVNVTFWGSFFITILGGFFKIFHWGEVGGIMAIGLLTSICFIVFSIFEVFSSSAISKNEKGMWVIGLILITPIVGLIYILSGRKRILRKGKL